MSAFDVAVADIIAERNRQDAKWGSQRSLDDGTWLAIATEELGEVAKSLLEDGASNYEEIVQLGAVTIAWLEARIHQSCTDEEG